MPSVYSYYQVFQILDADVNVMMARVKKDNAYIQCYHNTDYDMLIDNKLLFVINSNHYPVGPREIALYHPSFDFQCVYIGYKDEFELVESI